MNHTKASCGHSIIAVGAPGSIARQRAEESECRSCAMNQVQEDMRRDQIRSLMPSVIGGHTNFASSDGMFTVKKLNASCWALWKVVPPPASPRLRFGTKPQIEEDINYVLDNGILPPAAARMS